MYICRFTVILFGNKEKLLITHWLLLLTFIVLYFCTIPSTEVQCVDVAEGIAKHCNSHAVWL